MIAAVSLVATPAPHAATLLFYCRCYDADAAYAFAAADAAAAPLFFVSWRRLLRHAAIVDASTPLFHAAA